jgi:hypothetical protein
LVATLVFYWKKRELFNKTVSTAGTAGTPWVLIVSSVIGIGAFVFYIFAETFPIISGTFLGASLSLAYELVAAFLVIGVVIYAIGRARLQRSGIDIRQIYNDIPPE